MRIIEQSATVLDWSNLGLYERVETAARVCRRSESKGDAEGFVRSLIRRGHLSSLEFARIDFGGGKAVNARRVRELTQNNPDYAAAAYLPEMLFLWPAFGEDMPEEAEKAQRMAERKSITAAMLSEYVKAVNDWIPVLITTSRTISHQLVRYRHDITFCQESQRHVRYDQDGQEVEVIQPPGLKNRAKLIWQGAAEMAEAAYCNMMNNGATAEQARAVLPGCTATRILAYASPEEWRHIFSQRCDRHADPQMSALMIPLRDEMQRRGLI